MNYTPAQDNPFRTQRITSLTFKARHWTWPDMMGRLQAMQYRAAIVGPHGSGKTTLIDELIPRLHRLGFTTVHIRLNDRNRKLPDGVADHHSLNQTIVIIDGAEQLTRRRWWQVRWLTRHHAGLIITQHRPGRLATWITTRTDESLLEDLLQQLAPYHDFDIPTLFRQHRGNFHEVFRACYRDAARARAS